MTHGMTGKRNAAKDEPRNKKIEVIVTAREKAAITEKARAAGRTASDWLARLAGVRQ